MKGFMIEEEALEAVDKSANLGDYDTTYAHFKWEDVEKQFEWYKTGKVNVANEAIDRHIAMVQRRPERDGPAVGSKTVLPRVELQHVLFI